MSNDDASRTARDRYVLERVVDRIVAVEEGRRRVFEGGYSVSAEQAL